MNSLYVIPQMRKDQDYLKLSLDQSFIVYKSKKQNYIKHVYWEIYVL